ncbi:MAG TPA: DUF2167 domain-containing protein, partial [Fimbriiglobus sp.]
GKAHFPIPAEYEYLKGEELSAFQKLTEFSPAPEEVGVLLPDAGNWYISFSVRTDDPLNGIAKTEIENRASSEQLLKMLRAKSDARNKDRQAAGKMPLRITGWTHKPQYDKSENRVSWGYRLTDGDDTNDEDDELYYETILYGPNGEVLDVVLVSGVKAHSKPVDEYKKLLDSVTFGSAPGTGWFGLTTMAENDKAIFIGAVVIVIILGGGLMLRRSPSERKRPVVPNRNW